MRKTTNYNLSLYDKEDKMIITAGENSLNANMETIDNALNALDKALEEKVTLEDVANFAEENKEALKGETGPQGPQGPKGDNYEITNDDYEAIGEVVQTNIQPLLDETAKKEQFVTLTQAQYDALETKNEDTYYFIPE